MAKKITGPQLILANRLDDGRAVFLTAAGAWSKQVAEAAVANSEEELTGLLSVAQAAEVSNQVVSVTPVAADVSGDAVAPAHIKFAMQSKGPSVRSDLGYQVSPNWE
ncbi:MAG: DUF2849 domain-containing protein [Kordiimonadaceae bacterium]|nr:DUF2849 domain-containing protein [Kordiimonadaceae bacterium]MBO6569697.1 DUF2849 domain-containing protein [Kordiimonadaceae bacterium]MBO6966232.1 DUF2849 domain-containing protein [Kordiimonadaceae bacterium]